MIQEINSSLSITSTNTTLNAAPAESEKIANEAGTTKSKITASSSSPTPSTPISTPVDTVEISAEGQKALLNSQITSIDSEESDDSSSSSSNTTNLSQYTDSQLAALVSKGTITQAQANQELAKRQG